MSMGPSPTTASAAPPPRPLHRVPEAGPVRVLHVFGQMNRGGAETWVMQVLRAADRAEVAMDFLVGVPEPGHYDAEIAALGAAVIRGEPPAHPLRFARRLRAVLRARGPYDAVHSHVHHFSGFVLAVARAVGVALVAAGTRYISLSWAAPGGSEASYAALIVGYRICGRRLNPPTTYLAINSNNNTWLNPETTYSDTGAASELNFASPTCQAQLAVDEVRRELEAFLERFLRLRVITLAFVGGAELKIKILIQPFRVGRTQDRVPGRLSGAHRATIN